MADTETLGTSAVERLISRTDYLVPYISKKDKEPSWDGFIYAYHHASNNHPKDDLVGRAPVQVKGTENPVSTSYTVDISDLRNYLEDGGTIFFVVYITDNDEAVYYECLLPFELKQILKKHGEQNTYSIHLQKFPADKKEISDLVLNFIQNRDKQRAAIHAEEVSFDSLAKTGELDTISFGFTTVNQEKYHSLRMPMDYFFDHDLYLYAKFPHGLILPVEHIDRVTVAVKELNKTVSVDGKQYYSSYKIMFKRNTEEILFGKSLRLVNDSHQHTSKLTFTPKGNLTQRITDEEFIISALEACGAEFDGKFLPIFNCKPEEIAQFNLQMRKEHLSFLKDCKSVFDQMHVKRELDCGNMQKEDDYNLRRLVSAIHEKNLVRLKDIGQIAGKYNVGNIALLVFALKDTDSGLFRMYDFFDAPLEFRGVDQNQKEFPSIPCIRLKADELLNFDNIDSSVILEKIKEVPYSEPFENELTLFMLEVLKAYDSLKLPSHSFLRLASEINEYIAEQSKCDDRSVIELNRLQIKKRSVELTSSDLNELQDIINRALSKKQDNILTGAYILTGQLAEARRHLELLPDDEKTQFINYPICKFTDWNSEDKSAV